MNLYERLKEIKDHRRGQGRMHNLPTILIIVIMANMSGYFGERAIGDFIGKNRKELKKVFKPKRGLLPSRQTVGRAIRKVKFEELAKIFHGWARKQVEVRESEWMSIDGKVIGGTVRDASTAKQRYTNLVTVFSNKKKQAITAGEVGDKESEIPCVRRLIKDLDLEGVIFTLDALHCQKETTRVIRESKNDYVIGVKGNQKKLYKRIKKT